MHEHPARHAGTQFQDPSKPVDIGCGILTPIRSGAYGSILWYEHDYGAAPAKAHDKVFQFHCITVTTRGRWGFHGRSEKCVVDGENLAIGVAGDAYGCSHRSSDANYIVALRPDAVDADYPPIFGNQIVPARGALALLERALRAPDDARFDSLLFALYDDVSLASRGPARAASSGLRMQRAKRFLERHAFERVGLKDLAQELGLSPFTTVRQFRAATGMTPYAYLLELRLDRAKRMLARTTVPVAKIAEATGFESVAHFAHFFKSKTGASASAFRGKSTPLLDQPSDGDSNTR